MSFAIPSELSLTITRFILCHASMESESPLFEFVPKYQSSLRRRCEYCEMDLDNRGYSLHVRACKKKVETTARYQELAKEARKEKEKGKGKGKGTERRNDTTRKYRTSVLTI
jgi:hypothetical protein